MNHIGLNGKDSSNPGGNAHEPDWDRCLWMYRQEGIWDQLVLGPPPGYAGCRVPPLLLQFYGYDLDLDVITDAPCGAPGAGDGHEHIRNEPNNTNQDDAKTNVDSSWPDPCLRFATSFPANCMAAPARQIHQRVVPGLARDLRFAARFWDGDESRT